MHCKPGSLLNCFDLKPSKECNNKSSNRNNRTSNNNSNHSNNGNSSNMVINIPTRKLKP